MDSLRAIGIDPLEERIYAALLEHGPSKSGDIESSLGLPRERVRRLLSALESKGLVTRTPGSRSTYAAARPDLALEALVLRRQDELTRARGDVEHFIDRFRNIVSRQTDGRPIELVSGREAVAQWWMQIQRSARREVLIFDKPPYAMPFTEPNPIELELLRDGVAYRVLYDETSFDGDLKRAAVQACVEAGEQARVLVGLPIKLLVADEMLALTHDGAAVDEHAIVMHRSAVLGGLVALFNALWRAAAPLTFSGTGSADAALDQIDRTILTMLAAGSKDERIARQLRLSVRTVRRRITGLVERLGAETRFQAATIATRKRII